jgi:hypothetical protein
VVFGGGHHLWRAAGADCWAVLASQNFEGLSAWGDLCTNFSYRRFCGAFLKPDKADPVYKFGGFFVSFSRFNFVLHARGEAQYLCVLGVENKMDVLKAI